MPKVHHLDNLGEESGFSGTSAGRVDEFEIYEVQVVGRHSFVDIFARAIRVFSGKNELSIIHGASNFTPDGSHSSDREKVDACGGGMKTVTELNRRHDAFQLEADKAVATGPGLEHSVIRGSHRASLGDFVRPENVTVFKKVRRGARIQDARKTAVS